jgi:hypothetical protein
MSGDIKGSVVSTSLEDQRILQGLTMTFSRSITALAAAGNSDILLVTPASPRVFLTARVIAGAAHEVSIREAAITSADGAATTPVNRERNSAKTSLSVVTTDPTVSNAGTLLHVQSHLEQVDPAEFMLKPSTKYLIRVTNRDSVARDSHVRIDYEEAP